MKIKSALFRYALPLNRPLVVRGQSTSSREGLLLKITDNGGASAVGEISPLPGFSQESLKEAEEQVRSVKDKLFVEDIPSALKKLNGQFEEWLGKFNLYPSVRFGVEMALLNLLARQYNKPLRKIISETSHENIKICGLLQGDKDEVLQQAQQMMQEGITTFKAKVGGGDIQNDIDLVIALNNTFAGEAILRIDANQQWSFNDAITFSHEAGLASVEYVEEPFADLTRVEEFSLKTTIPVALDESLLVKDFDEIKSVQGVEVLTLKPMMLGGIEKTWQWMQRAKQAGISVVLSSSFETGLGIDVLTNLACCARVEYPAGLDTLKWFKEDIVQNPPKIEKGQIDVPSKNNGEPQLNTHLIEEIPDE